MSNEYSGSAAGIDEDTDVTVTTPAAGDPAAAATFAPGYEQLADLVEYLRGHTVKRTQSGLGASQPHGQGGFIPIDIDGDGPQGVGGLLFNAKASSVVRQPIGFFPADADTGPGYTGVYRMPNGDLVLARGCSCVTLGGVATWTRNGSATAAVYVYRFTVAGGLIVQSKSAGGAGDSWADDAWSKSIAIDVASGVQGDVLGFTSGSAVGFGRPREHGGAPTTFLSGWGAGVGLGVYKGADGRVQWFGELVTPNTIAGGSAAAVCDVPAAYQPVSNDPHFHAVLPCYGSATGNAPWTQHDYCIAEYNAGNIDLYHLPNWAGSYLIIGMNQLSYLP